MPPTRDIYFIYIRETQAKQQQQKKQKRKQQPKQTAVKIFSTLRRNINYDWDISAIIKSQTFARFVFGENG